MQFYLNRKSKYFFLNKSFLKPVLFLFFAVFLFWNLTGQAWATSYYLNSAAESGGNGKSTATVVPLGNELITTDAGLEDVINNWGSWTYPQIASSTDHHEGSHSAKISINAANDDVRMWWPKTGANPIVNGTRYKLTFWAKGTAVFSILPGYRGSGFTSLTDCALTTEWRQYTFYFTSAQTNISRLEFGRKAGENAGKSQDFYIDDVSLKEVGDSAWATPSQITGIVSGDTLNFHRGDVFRATDTINPVYSASVAQTIQTYGNGNRPVVTRLVDYSPATGASWTNTDTPAEDIYKLPTVINAPLLAPWGRTGGGHPEENRLNPNISTFYGGFEVWIGDTPATPVGWTKSESGSSTVTKRSASPLSETYSADLNIDGSNSKASLSRTVALLAEETYVLRILHKETGTGKIAVSIKDETANKYWASDQSGWSSDASLVEFPTNATSNETWIYFSSAGANNYTFSVQNGAGSANSTLTVDEYVVIEKYWLNDSFMVGKCSASDWTSQGFAAMQRVQRGLSINNMTPGTWAWTEDNVFYYRLAAGETIDNLHIEIMQGNWTSSLNSISINAANVVISDIDFAFNSKYHISSSINTSDNISIDRCMFRHADIGVIIQDGDDAWNVRNNIAFDMFEYGFYVRAATNATLFNNSAYHILSNSGFFLYNTGSGHTVKNCAAADSREYALAKSSTGGNIPTASNNAWYGNVSAEWPTTNSVQNQDLKFIDPNNYDFQLQSASPAIDSGIDIGLTTDYAGNPIYGTPDIGAYEYQPPNDMVGLSKDEIDIGAGARIYGDGKFRNYGTTSEITADLAITPQSGSFTSYGSSEARPQWLDITNITWSNTGTHHKVWTESSISAGLTNTVHTIGDLEANKYYNVKVDSTLGQNISGDNCVSGVCKANAQNKITFTYTGTYSDHTFDVEEGDNIAPTIVSVSSDKANSSYKAGEVIDIDVTFSEAVTSTGNVIVTLETGTTDQACTFTMSNSETGTCNYTVQDGNSSSDLDVKIISGTITDQTGNPLTNFIPATNLAGNKNIIIDTTSPAISDTVPQSMNYSAGTDSMNLTLNADSSSDFIPTLAIGNSKIYRLSSDISLAVRSKYVVFRGKINSLQNGRVELYQDGKLKKRDKINKHSKWRIRIKERSRSTTHTYQFKYYNQDNQIIETSQIFTVIIDREKPKFTYLPKHIQASPGDTITWEVSDNDQVKNYRYTFRGRKIDTTDNFFTLSAFLPKGQSNLAVRAYDRAGNKTVRRVKVRVR